MVIEFLSIKEAAERYDKAEITIRRLVRSVVQKKTHADRKQIRPSATDVAKLKKQKKPYSYSISTALLDKTYEVKQKTAEVKATKERETETYRIFLEKTTQNLEEQLKVKDEQIRALNQALDDLSERQRETNVLMKGLQERLLIPQTTAQGSKWWKIW